MTNATDRARGFYEQVYNYDHPINYVGDEDSFDERNRPLRDVLIKWMTYLHVPDEATVVEIVCGIGHLHACHPYWHGIEYASTSANRAKENHGDSLNVEQGNAIRQPLESGSVDFLFSSAALEPVPEVKRASQEIGKVLRLSEAALISHAWSCRPRKVRRLGLRPHSDLSPFEIVENC